MQRTDKKDGVKTPFLAGQANESETPNLREQADATWANLDSDPLETHIKIAISGVNDFAQLTDPDSPETIALADRLIRGLGHQVKPWGGWRLLLTFIIASVAASASAASAPHFAARFIHGMEEYLPAYLKDVMQVFIAFFAGTPAALLTGNSVTTTLGQALYNFRDTQFSDIKRNAIPLTLTGGSAFVSATLNYNAMKDYQSMMSPQTFEAVQTGSSVARGGAASFTNGFFAVKMQRDLRGNKDVPEMTVLLDAGKKLEKLVSSGKCNEYIKLMDKGLFKSLMRVNETKTGDSIQDINTIFSDLYNIVADEQFTFQAGTVSTHSHKKTMTEVACYIFALLASITYFTSGQSTMEDLFKLPGQPAKWTGGSALGFASVIVNLAIAATGLIKFIQELMCKLPSKSECFALPFRIMLLVMYASIQGGQAKQYPLQLFDDPAAQDNLATIQAIITFCVSFTIAGLSFDGFASKASIGCSVHYHKTLKNLETAINEGQSLEKYYHDLNPDQGENGLPNQAQKRLIQVLEDYRKWAFDDLRHFCQNTKKEAIVQIFRPDLYNNLDGYHRRKKNLPPIAAPVPTTPVATDEIKGATLPVPIPHHELTASMRLRATQEETYTDGGISVPVNFGSIPKPEIMPSPSPLTQVGSFITQRMSSLRRSAAPSINGETASPIVLEPTSSNRSHR